VACFVLIHGAWHGGWCWRDVAQPLRARGHEVFHPSLTGLADRAHLLSPQVTLDTHIQDVVGLIESESLDGCVLVGHSYAGTVITGVADRLRERISHYVFLDASLPPDGREVWCWSDQHCSSVRTARLAQISGEGRGVFLPAPPAEAFGLTDPEHCAWVGARLSPMPASLYTSPMVLRRGGSQGLRRTYIAAVDPVYEPLRGVHEMLRGDPTWSFLEIPTGHDAMVSAPERLVDVLVSLT
jgi:pimeloyl-ACP methyl ester carboxylesterase